MRWTYLLEKYRSITNLAGTVLVGWTLSAIVCQMIGLALPDAPLAVASVSMSAAPVQGIFDPLSQEKKLDYYMPICTRNIFDSQKRAVCTQEAGPGEGQEATLDLNSAPIKSDLQATLLGTVVFPNPNRSFATIQLKSGGKGADPYHVDDSIPEGAKVYAIQRNKVFFVRNGHREYLEVENLPSIYMSSPTATLETPQYGGVKLEGDKAIVSRAKVEATLGDLNQVIQQARMVPNMANGAVDGFKVFAIRPGSIFQELGLKNGDVVQRINGNEINSVEKAIPMLQLARTESAITIDLTRDGVKKTLRLDIR